MLPAPMLFSDRRHLQPCIEVIDRIRAFRGPIPDKAHTNGTARLKTPAWEISLRTDRQQVS
jgi:hypothetical protein